MATLFPLQSILLGLMGWAAMSLAVMNASRLTDNDRRVMVVFSWMLWMIPALGALVYRGVISTNTAAIYCGATTLTLGAIVIVASLIQHHPPRTDP